MFSSDEIIIIQSALETYNDEPRDYLKPDLQDKLTKSSLSKLSNYSPLTYFTKQEYSIMCLAVIFMMNLLEDVDPYRSDELFLISKKLSALADPNRR